MKDLLGFQVEDIVTGYKGIAEVKNTHVNGNVQYGVRPKVKEGEEGTFPDSTFIDEHTLKPIGEEPAIPVIPYDVERIEHGSKVEDKPTGYKGIVVSEAIYTNGCVHYRVDKNGLSKDKGEVVTEWFSAQRLTVIKPVSSIKEEKKIEKSTTGGPSISGKKLGINKRNKIS